MGEFFLNASHPLLVACTSRAKFNADVFLRLGKRKFVSVAAVGDRKKNKGLVAMTTGVERAANSTHLILSSLIDSLFKISVPLV